MNKVILKGVITSKWINDKNNFGNISIKIEENGFVSYVSVKVFANKINEIQYLNINDSVEVLGRVQRNKMNDTYSTDIVLNSIKVENNQQPIQTPNQIKAEQLKESFRNNIETNNNSTANHNGVYSGERIDWEI